ncbi:transcriptional regulator family: Fungal Specific TF [Penicillium fimorum]|uniref:Transcriptional regulator family: Fungal Specific TF n=1 Tax=Penicillium fimorum TaxID=1882269 RepID=A0A9X0C1D5_9EURO|nr:transcriptional regulator family: Fungal Specific TF [Penicillium fimorum]
MTLYQRTAKPRKSVMVTGLEWDSEFQDKIKDFGYSSHGIHNSMSLLQTAELNGGQDTSVVGFSATNQFPFPIDADCKYRELIRQLPSQACINNLVQTFFSDINWQEDLAAWGKISYSDLRTGFGRLVLGTIVFPALLIQVLAQALLFHSPHDDMIISLITIPDMTFHDFGAEYSDAGAELLAVLGEKDIILATAQAGLLRASFLKSSDKVIEAWHALGATIRDAQEIGLHTGRSIPGQSLVGPSHDRHNISLVGHKVWVVLHIWDLHMAVVLGRLIVTDLQIDRFARSIEDEAKRRELFSHWGAALQDYPTVERIHAAIKTNFELLPSWCRLENPDTKLDRLPGYQWLPVAREALSSLINLVLLALHRPYIFSVANSQTEAERLFQKSQPHQCKVFNPVYASFDAIVLLAALCLVFPNKDHEQRPECIDVVQRGM